MTEFEVLIQQTLNGLSNGMIIALIAIGYTLVYGIVELINFAHGDLVMLGAFMALTLVDCFGYGAGGTADPAAAHLFIVLIAVFVVSALWCGVLNYAIDRLFYRPIRAASRLSQLVTAIGISFVFLNMGLFWGGLPLESFAMGRSAASPKDFPVLLGNANLLGDSAVQLTGADVLIWCVTIPLLAATWFVIKRTKFGTAMRAVAQNPTAATLMGIDVERVISLTFFFGGLLGGIASVVYSLYNSTVYFQMGYRIGLDGFTAAVLGGIGNLPGAMLGGLLIGIVRAMSDQYIATQWTNTMVFAILILVLVFRPTGILGARVREKV